MTTGHSPFPDDGELPPLVAHANRIGERIQYTESYAFFFANPNWGMNLLLVTVCQLIPFIGPLVMMGYQFEIIESLQRDPRITYPDFDFDKFVHYLKRGLWPFLVLMAVSLLAVPLLLVPMIVAGMAGVSNEEAAVFVFVAAILFVVLLQFVIYVLLAPMVLRAGLTGEFGQGFDIGFIQSFLSRVWVELLLCLLFLVLSSFGLTILGLMLCFVGVYPANSLVWMATAHLLFQLYQLYLARGGKPIPLQFG